MSASRRNLGPRHRLQFAGALLLCGAISLVSVGIGMTGAQSAHARAAGKHKCVKTRGKGKHKKAARKKRARCKRRSAGNCPLTQPGSTLGMTLPSSCRIDRADTASDPNKDDIWGDETACQSGGRITRPATGGDTDPIASGDSQGNGSYRVTTVLDGDNYWGERCELAKNSWTDGLASPSNQVGTFYNYREGDRRATYFSMRLPSGFPINANSWQVVTQMKQAGPSNNSSGTPVIEMDVYGGRWRLRQSLSPGEASDSRELWSAPAQTGTWTRFAYDVTYSQDPSVGRIKVYVDLNGDGDFNDANEQSPAIQTYTLKYEIPGPKTGLAPGQSIPSHLRMGVYHDSSIACPPPTGCSVDIDNVQVARP